MKRTILAILAIGLIGFQSCRKTNTPEQPDPTQVKTIEDLSINDDFDFSNTTNHELKILLPQTVEYDNFRSKIEIRTAAKEDGGKLISSVTTDKNGLFEGNFELPKHLDSIYVSTKYRSITASLSNTKASLEGIIDFGDDYEIGIPPPDSTIEGYKSQKIQATTNSYAPAPNQKNNIIGNGDFSENDFGTTQWWDTPHPADNRWYFSNWAPYGTMNWKQDGSNGYIETPNNSFPHYSGGASQIVEAKAGDVITVSADIRRTGNSSSQLYSYIYLIPQNSSGQNLKFYRLYYYHPKKQWTTKTLVATMPPQTTKVHVLLWNSDYNGSSSIAWDNVTVTGPVNDMDDDGVADDEDDYPEDSERAFNIYYPNEEDFATLAFEDNWPGKGDYDFNDLVIDYQYKQVINSDNGIVDLYGKFDVVAIGASFNNGFGFQMGADPNSIESVTGQNITEDYINLEGNGTESGQDKATVIVFDNAYEILAHPGGGYIGVNTQPEAPYINEEPIDIHVSFKNPVSQNINGTAPFNPFIIIDQDRDREAHLADMEPTSLVKDVDTYFGKEEDDSDADQGRYYKTEKNLPWAINIPVSFDYPIEKIEIIDAHLHFAEWAEGSGNIYEDWYLNKSGYRNNSNIYIKPE